MAKKPNGYWHDRDNFDRELNEAIDKNEGIRPNSDWLNANGYSGIVDNSVKYGGLTKILDERFGDTLRKPAGYWPDRENFDRELRDAIEENGGERPNVKWLRNNGYGGIIDASGKYFDGLEVELDRITQERLEKPFGYWIENDNLQRDLKDAIKKNNGDRPTSIWLINNGYSGLVNAIKRQRRKLSKILDDYFSEGVEDDQLRSLLEEYIGDNENA